MCYNLYLGDIKCKPICYKLLSVTYKITPLSALPISLVLMLKGEHRDDSNIDLALYLQKNNLDILLQINYELSKIAEQDIDIVVLKSVKNIYLTDAILRDGIILKDSPQRIDFELKMLHNILDFKEFRRYIDAI